METNDDTANKFTKSNDIIDKDSKVKDYIKLRLSTKIRIFSDFKKKNLNSNEFKNISEIMDETKLKALDSLILYKKIKEDDTYKDVIQKIG